MKCFLFRRAVPFALLAAVLPTARAQNSATLETLHVFQTGEGTAPAAELVQASDGNFYGTTTSGGSANNGTVFRLTPAGEFTTLHSFQTAEGSQPQAALVEGSDGNLYGTARSGGASGYGTVYSITPAGEVTVLHSFDIGDGAAPVARLLPGGDGFFYGTASTAGASDGGTVFRISPAGAFTVLHAFTGLTGDPEGYDPESGMTPGGDGFFYGVTVMGGDTSPGINGFGTVYRISADGTLTTLFAFAIGGSGTFPAGALVPGGDGFFYGNTVTGGYDDGGTIYRITAVGDFLPLSQFVEDLTTFPGGYYPRGNLLQGSDGLFYGVTSNGGSADLGAVFQVTRLGSVTGLHSLTGGSDGTGPRGGLVQGSDGSFYGTTATTIYRLTLHPGFFTGESAVGSGVYYLTFPDGIPFGYTLS